ncbi:hypothetical protein QYF36_018927 [Acer negundo]|nr:hypothetical protein QYF36_018927 [Acer negundo]
MGEQSGEVQGVQNENILEDVKNVNKQLDTESDAFGPWMQVSYNRPSRNNVRASYTGRRNGSIGYFGKAGNGNQDVSGPSINGAGKFGKDREGRTDVGKGMTEIDSRKMEEYGSRGSQTGISLQTMANSGNVLAEISNIVSYRKNSSSTISNKYLKDDDMVKTCFNKPFKETMPQKRVVGKGRKNNKGKLHVTDSQTSDMVEVLEDSDVLKSLHKEVIGVVSFDNQSVLPIADYNSKEVTPVSITVRAAGSH